MSFSRLSLTRPEATANTSGRPPRSMNSRHWTPSPGDATTQIIELTPEETAQFQQAVQSVNDSTKWRSRTVCAMDPGAIAEE